MTKYRRGVPGADMLRCCQDATRKACGDFGAELREFNAEDDHVHLVAGSVTHSAGADHRLLVPPDAHPR